MPVAAGITLSSVIIFSRYGIATFFALFWFKVITSVLIWYSINTYRRQYFYYYLNNGLGKSQLWGVTLSVDGILFLLSLYTCYHTR